jgi:signal transduction histidine kinase
MFNSRRWPQRLYIRIYFAVLGSVALVAVLYALVWHWSIEAAQARAQLEAMAEAVGDTLPAATTSPEEQLAALRRWRPRTHPDLALYTADGHLIAEVGRELPPPDLAQPGSYWIISRPPIFALKLHDGRWLVGKRTRPPRGPEFGLFLLLGVIAVAIGVGAYPVVRRLTGRLERLQTSVEALGAGQLSTRVAVEGDDEVAHLATSFNRSAQRIEALVAAQKSLLANASHELRSPLARIRMAVQLMETPANTPMQEELSRNIAELDQLIDEILLASRLDAASDGGIPFEAVDLSAVLAEECARVDAQFSAEPVTLQGDPKLLRRMVRNLLENAKRYGDGMAVEASLCKMSPRALELDICDRGKGVPEAEREKIFDPFYRLPGARERDGGVGLGLSLVRQIARKHGGEVVCTARVGGGSCFRITLPITET